MKTIYLVEQNQEFGQQLKTQLERLHYNVEWGTEYALPGESISAPDVIVITNDMEHHANSLIEKWRTYDSPLRHIPIIALLESDTSEDAVRVKLLGANDAISKLHITLPELANRIVLATETSAVGHSDGSTHHTPTIILVVEDDVFLSEIFSDRLKKSGYRVLIAHDGAEALGVSRKESPDIMLLDLIMPGMSGYEVLRQMKEDAQLRAIPVVVCSNLAQESEVNMAMQLGAIDYLVKSAFVPAQLIEKVTAILAKISKGR